MTIFSKIIAGDIPAYKIAENDQFFAFLDIFPLVEGHVLVVPKQQYRTLAELPPEVGAHLFVVGQKVAAAVRASNPRVAGVNLFLADGTVAGQEIFHVHLHIIPRFAGDEFGFRFGPNYTNLPERHELDSIAAQIKQQLEG